MAETVEVIEARTLTKKALISILIASLAFSLGFIHYKYVSILFENDRNFSHLSELEREMSFRTEMGFYYSYYKTLIEANQFSYGLLQLIYDRLVEYPKDVNAFLRFNIYPEVIIASAYRSLEPMINTSKYRECHMVERGGGHSPVESCVGIGQPIYFYLEVIWWLAGLTVAALFLHAVTLSQSIVGGLLAVMQYFTNHAECTRVQWAPNERENFAVPFLILQMWLLTMQLQKKCKTTLQLQISIFIVNVLCILFWQFTQFIFLTQLVIFFLMEQLKVITIKMFSIYLHSQYWSIQSAIIILQGNDMLKTSLFPSVFIVLSVYCVFFSSCRVKVQNRLDLFIESLLVVTRVILVAITSVYLKRCLSAFFELDEDSHIWEILYSKFTNYKTFHSLIYTCSEVFDFLPLSSVINLTKSLLLPLVLLNIINLQCYWTSKTIKKCMKEVKVEKQEDDDSGIENTEKRIDLDEIKSISLMNDPVVKKDALIMCLSNLDIDADVLYNLCQMVVYGLMAALVMRLKLLFTTQMCVVFSLTFNKAFYAFPKVLVPFTWVLYFLTIFSAMVNNIGSEMSHIGEFSDYQQEQMLKWIAQEAGPGAFAGSMPISAAVMLTTRRPIIIHPHYENLELRNRAYNVHKMYGKFPPEEYYRNLTKMRATYLIVETRYCYGKSSKGCSFENIWDIEAPELRSAPRLCHTLLTEQVDHFYPVFRNEHYAIFRVHDFSVRYMPRSFDT